MDGNIFNSLGVRVAIVLGHVSKVPILCGRAPRPKLLNRDEACQPMSVVGPDSDVRSRGKQSPRSTPMNGHCQFDPLGPKSAIGDIGLPKTKQA
jgi:hypothetical protein